MDAGLAAVLGALAGSVATIGAALATGWAQREGARIAARSEHRRERRGPRENIYKEFVASVTRMRLWSGIYSLDPDVIPDDMGEEETGEIFRVVNEIERKATDAALAGPKKVAQAARRVARIGYEMAAYASALPRFLTGNAERDRETRRRVQLQVNALAKQFEQSVDDFVLDAQAALDDDGSRR
ncbi:hypothetical protein [Streptomyces sp. NPDC001508]|uniref:hypothetical protein n=1 Tax=Streptomyces sp. NPDC001508 TaxID=3154656 RepID=UPI00331D39C7